MDNIFYDSLDLLFTLDSYLLEIIGLSLYVSFSALIISITISLPIASLLSIKKFVGKDFITIVFNSLMSLPPVAVGVILYILISYNGPFGNLELLYTPAAMIIAQTILVVPIIVSLSKDSIDNCLNYYQDYFLSINANFTSIMKTILWEVRYKLLTNILAGLGRALSEVGAIIIVGGNIDHLTRVMTTSIVLETSRGNLAKALGLGISLILIALIINIALSLIKNKELERNGEY
jgi:tungstate transport system permease protein|tara:strand:+ start:858 stop:1559 length:702 start_codon:yes stop_codon:yes gene_type:complete